MDAVIDDLPEILFWEIDTVEIDGVKTWERGHGMVATAGLELFTHTNIMMPYSRK